MSIQTLWSKLLWGLLVVVVFRRLNVSYADQKLFFLAMVRIQCEAKSPVLNFFLGNMAQLVFRNNNGLPTFGQRVFR